MGTFVDGLTFKKDAYSVVVWTKDLTGREKKLAEEQEITTNSVYILYTRENSADPYDIKSLEKIEGSPFEFLRNKIGESGINLSHIIRGARPLEDSDSEVGVKEPSETAKKILSSILSDPVQDIRDLRNEKALHK